MLLKDKEQKGKLKSGILLSVTSLPSPYGIGSLGEECFSFLDFLRKTRQSYWQLLPLCPFGKGNSPYSSYSSFAGEILLIDIPLLVNSGLLREEDIPKTDFQQNVDYQKVRKFKLPLLKKAAANFDDENRDFKAFKRENAFWLKDFALFMAIKDSFSGAPFYNWEDSLKYRLPDALKAFEDTHREEILFYEITQFLFFSQFLRVKNYAERCFIKLIGDIPFYVSLDSADVWSNPDCFKLGRDMKPLLVAGVPPDLFSSTGQLWGNPIYDWEHLRKNNYPFWKERLFHYSRLYHTVRIDHFRAFANYYAIPSSAPDARSGKWEKGIGFQFFSYLKDILKNTEIIAEDLGEESIEVDELINRTGFPNMKVLQFAFDSDLKDRFLPRNFSRNCVCYTGTHDNDTTIGWYEKAEKKEKLLFDKLVPKAYDSVSLNLISFAMKSKAKTVIIPLQDYLELPSKDRMNTPGTENGNWEWRYLETDLSDTLADTVLRLSKGRN